MKYSIIKGNLFQGKMKGDFSMQGLEQTLDSREVAEMVEKDHAMLLRDLRRYEKQFTECKIAVSDFFLKSEYKDSTGRTLPCYRITKKGCEFIAHKLTGTKGTEFTARYINRFHEMENKISEIAKPEVSTEQMEKLLGFMEKQQQFIEDQEKFNQMVIKKLESTKRIQAHQNESDRKIFAMSSRKKQIINLLDTVDDGDFKFLNQIYTMIKTHVRIICGQQYGT